jgi:hypothetical protein
MVAVAPIAYAILTGLILWGLLALADWAGKQ